MKLRLIHIALPILFGISASASAAPEDMVVSSWDYGCEHTMTTNHFELAPGESVKVNLDLSACPDEQLGSLLFFGYHTTKNSSKQFVRRDNIRLTLVDEAMDQEVVSDNGHIFVEVADRTKCVLYAENRNRNKSMKIRLRSSSGL